MKAAVFLIKSIFFCLKLFFFTANQLVQNLLIKAGKEMFSKAHASSEWFQESRNNLVEPAIYGLLISIFTAMMVYLDSDIPGLSPPTPFSPRKAKQ